MFAGYVYPFYRSFVRPYPYPVYGLGGYGLGGGFGNNYGSNIFGSAISNNSIVNTGGMYGVNQISTPTVIW